MAAEAEVRYRAVADVVADPIAWDGDAVHGSGTRMDIAVDLVARHIDALSKFDWTTLSSSMSTDPKLRLVGVTDWEWTVPTLYRMVTKAWESMPKDVELEEESGGTVRALLRLEDGRCIEGMYRVTGGQIDQITLIDPQISGNV